MEVRPHTRRIRISIVVLAVATLLAGCGNDEPPAAATKNITIQAGLNDPNDKTIAVMAFLPAEATVEVGAEVTWNFPGPEPHTVTFIPPGAKPPLPTDPDSGQPFPATGSYDGTTKVGSGLLGFPQPGTFKLTFGKAGSYTYYCSLHPVHPAKLNVVASGQEADSQREIDARARTERDRFLAEGRAAKQQYAATQPRQTKNADGSATWTVETGTSTQHTSILAFQPSSLSIKSGDKVIFVNNDPSAPHTASFAGTKQLPQNPESAEAMNPAPGGSPQTLNATDLFNTGWLPPNAPPGSGPPLAVRSFTFNVPAAGTYAYVCILHAPSGQAGSIAAT
jgi:plastocyanin